MLDPTATQHSFVQSFLMLPSIASTTIWPTDTTTTTRSTDTIEPSPSRILPVMFTGTAGTCVGSRIRGHARRGGGKLREEHRRHGIVAMTNEFCTSKTCIYCFARVRQAKARRLVDGKVKTLRLNGAVECLNPRCPSRKHRYTIRSRDPHAAAAIAIAGASNLFSQKRETIQPFSQVFRPSNIARIDDTNNTSSRTLETNPCSRYPDDTTWAPLKRGAYS